MTQQESTLETVARLVREVVGDDFPDDLVIESGTSFSDDLELESIEFVALAEKIQAHYGESVNFVAWLSDMELDRIIALRVGDLVEFIDRCR